MKAVHLAVAATTLVAIMLLTACTTTPAHNVPMPSNVTVQFQHPKKFTENHRNGFGHGYDHNGYLEKLKTFLIKTASPLLQPGQHLAITITDIDLAGGYEPWHGPRMSGVRFMRNVYPPRFDLNFQLTDADGKVLRHGQRKLTDLGYLQDFSPMVGDSDPLRYDKALLARWLRRGPAKW